MAVKPKKKSAKKNQVNEKHIDREEQWQKLYQLVAKKLRKAEAPR